MVNLNTLGLSSNQISDLTPLTNITSALTTLDLGSNRVNNISPLAGMTNLQDARSGEQSDWRYQFIGPPHQRVESALDRNQIGNISVLAGLINLSTVTLHTIRSAISLH